MDHAHSASKKSVDDVGMEMTFDHEERHVGDGGKRLLDVKPR
jgi:hypothetical protein